VKGREKAKLKFVERHRWICLATCPPLLFKILLAYKAPQILLFHVTFASIPLNFSPYSYLPTAQNSDEWSLQVGQVGRKLQSFSKRPLLETMSSCRSPDCLFLKDATLGATVQYASELRLQACMHAKLLDVGRWSYSSCAVQLCRGVEYLASMSLNLEDILTTK
jgi:hypothetical protein